jgi:hypothetical protein
MVDLNRESGLTTTLDVANHPGRPDRVIADLYKLPLLILAAVEPVPNNRGAIPTIS